MNEIVSPVQSISYTNRDFTSVYTELLDLVKELTSKWDPSISNESDPGVILLKLNAVIADKCNYAIDKSLLECFPLSVTQEQNARQLYEQLGYFMHWYRSAVTDVYIKWAGEAESTTITIPKFTMVCDSNNNIVYSILGYSTGLDSISDITLDLADPIGVTVRAIQGVATNYEINGDNLITISSLDYDNRLYFPVTNVAENGIFITNVGQNNYSSWVKKDNLLVENLGNTYYKFGVINNGAACYIEFPEDAENLIGEGINITYIKTDGEQGNISAKQLDRFYNMNVATSGNSSYDLNTDTVLISNFSASVGGRNSESINEAYQSYKKTVGTFDTLVTLRDYINFINNSGLVSNCFVCDRNTDIQTTYKVLSSINNIDQLVNVVEKDNGNDVITAYDIKLYLLQYVEPIDANTSKYLDTFRMLNNDERRTVEAYIEDRKSLNHTVVDILPPTSTSSHICFFKNKCPVSFTVITQSSLTPTQIVDMRTNIVKAIYDMFQSKNLEFGEKLSYDLLYTTIINSDTRIKNISLDNLTYQTFAVYYDNDVKFTYDGTHWLDNDWNVVNPLDYGINPPAGAIAGATIKLPDKFIEVDLNSDELISVISSNKELELTVDNSESSISNIKQFLNGVSLDVYSPVEAVYSSGNWVYNGTVTISSTALGNMGITVTGTPSNGDKLRFRISYAYQFRNEIFAKSVLAGTTQLYIKDETYDYRLQGRYQSIVDNIEKIESNVNITISNSADTYTLRENESLQFYTPNLINSDSYQKYTKFEYYVSTDIPANSSRQLNDGEYVIFYWKANEDEVYQYHSYGKGTIICPNFLMLSESSLVNPVGKDLLNEDSGIYYETSTGLNGEMSTDIDADVKDITSLNNILSGTKAINIQKLNTFSLDKSSGVYVYWVLNSEDENGRYVLFEDGESTRILSTNEYFIFTNKSYTSYTTLGAGTTITRSNSTGKWQVNAIDTSEIVNYGLLALQDSWFVIPDGESIDLIENRFTTLGEGCSVKIAPNSSDNITAYSIGFSSDGYTISTTPSGDYTLADFNIQYKLPDSDTFVTMDKLTLTDDVSLNAKSLLAIRLSSTDYQELLNNQSITYYIKDDDNPHSIAGSPYNTTNNYYPVALMSSFSVIGSGDSTIYTSTTPIDTMFSDDTETEYLSIYEQQKQCTASGANVAVVYNDDGTVVFNFTTSGTLTNSIQIALPVGEYILPVQNNNDSTAMTSCTMSLGGDAVYVMNGSTTNIKDNGIHYMHLSVADDDATTLSMTVAGLTSNLSIKLLNIYKYQKPDNMDDATYNEIQRLIQSLDTTGSFKYNNEVEVTKLIPNPLEPTAFFNINHIYNSYTIPVISSISIS